MILLGEIIYRIMLFAVAYIYRGNVSSEAMSHYKEE